MAVYSLMMRRSKLSGAQGRRRKKEDGDEKAKYRGTYNDAIIIIKQN